MLSERVDQPAFDPLQLAKISLDEKKCQGPLPGTAADMPATGKESPFCCCREYPLLELTAVSWQIQYIEYSIEDISGRHRKSQLSSLGRPSIQSRNPHESTIEHKPCA